MKKKLLIVAGVVAVSCAAMLGGLFDGMPKVSATSEQGLVRTPILGFSTVPGEVFLEIHRDEIDKRLNKNSGGLTLAKYTLTNSGGNDIEINNPRFYAMADKSFTLQNEVKRVSIYNPSEPAHVEASYVGNRVEIPATITVPAYESMEMLIIGDVPNTTKIDALEFEPDFTSSKFVINYADEMGNDLALAPFNLTGDVQSLNFSNIAGGVEVSTASNSDYARYYWGVKGTLTSPYIPEGAIMRNEAGIDVYIAKYKKNKRFKRLILSPSVFKSYGHLKWENILIVNDAVMESYTTSDYVFVAGENKIWRLEPQGDTGIKREFEGYGNPVWAFDTDGLYEIDTVDRDSYVTGTKIER